MTQRAQGRAAETPGDVSPRSFLAGSAAGAVAATGMAPHEANAQGQIRWDHTVDVVVGRAGVAGLPAAVAARDHGASVIVVDENYDIGRRGMLAGRRAQLGGGHALQQKLNIQDSLAGRHAAQRMDNGRRAAQR